MEKDEEQLSKRRKTGMERYICDKKNFERDMMEWYIQTWKDENRLLPSDYMNLIRSLVRFID